LSQSRASYLGERQPAVLLLAEPGEVSHVVGQIQHGALQHIVSPGIAVEQSLGRAQQIEARHGGLVHQVDLHTEALLYGLFQHMGSIPALAAKAHSSIIPSSKYRISSFTWHD
jgi:hypothetical protein